jgi:DUF971 family protein
MEGNEHMTRKHIAISAIQQVDNHTFEIAWMDGSLGVYRLSELQKACPCANCRDESTGQRRPPASPIDDNVKAHKIHNIGRYGLKIKFTSGCSTGIFPYDLLHQMAKK